MEREDAILIMHMDDAKSDIKKLARRLAFVQIMPDETKHSTTPFSRPP